MPIYEYYCASCQEEVTVLYSTIAEAPAEADALCPECGADGLERLISRFGFTSTGAGGPRQSDGAGALRGGAEDSRGLADAMRRAKSGGDRDFKEVAHRLERGESATSIETSLRKRVGETVQAH